MNDLGTLIGLSVLAAGVVLSRVLSERAFRKLDDQMKIKIMNEFSGMRIWNIIPVLAIVILMVAGNAVYGGHELLIFGAFLAALIGYFVITHRLIKSKLLRVQAPDTYLCAFMSARWISYLTLVLMLAALLGDGLIRGLVP